MPSIYWKDHSDHIMGLVAVLYKNSELTDCMLDTEGGSVKCHKTILAACSLYFKKLFMDHVGMEIIPFKHVKYNNMKLILNLLYYGKADIPHSDVASLMETAELLQISAFPQALLKENSVVCYQDVLSEQGQELNSSCHNIDSQPLVDLETKAVNVLCEMSVNVNEDESKVSIPNSRMGEATVCEDPEDFENEMKPITFVAVSPASVTSEELDEERALPVTDPLLHNSLDSEDNCESTEVVNDEVENNCGSVSNMEVMEIKQEVDVCDSDSVPFSGEKKHSCDELTMPVDDNTLHGIEWMGGIHSDQHALPDRVEECEVKFESVCDFSDGELKETNSFPKCLDVDKLHVIVKKEVEKYGALESPDIKCANLLPNQVEAGYESSASNVNCGLWRTEIKRTEQEKDTNINFAEDQEYSNCTQSDAYISKTSWTRHTHDRENFSQSNLTFGSQLAELTKTSSTFENTLEEDVHSHPRVKSSTSTCGTGAASLSGKSDDVVGRKKTDTREKLFECGSCTASFSKRKSLTTHIRRTHTGGKRFKCTFCALSFNAHHHFVIHVRTHTGEKPYECDNCKATFTDKSSLIKHTRTHTGEKPYKCDICNTSYSVKSTLVSHTRIHTGEKPFKCGSCEAIFTHRSNLIRHKKIHSGEKPFACSGCELSFAQRSSLVIHLRTHTGEKPFGCAHCELSFSRKSSLVKHTRTHTGEKPFVCGICKTSFSAMCFLVKHMQTHSGEQNFECGSCKASFCDKITLVKHFQSHSSSQ